MPVPVLVYQLLCALDYSTCFHISVSLIVFFRILNACSHVIEETVPGPPQAKPSLPSLSTAPSLSPVKRKVKGEKEAVSSLPAGPAIDAKVSQKTPVKGAFLTSEIFFPPICI